MSCVRHAQLVAYWANDVDADEHDAIEDHLFVCDACVAAAERVARIAQGLRRSLPPVISPAELEGLRSRGLAIVETSFVAGQRTPVAFAPGVDLLIHRLGGLDLTRAERVEVVVRSEASGFVMMQEPFAPFDRERGEVLIACQRHFEAFPADVVFDVRVFRGGVPAETAEYIVPHVYSA